MNVHVAHANHVATHRLGAVSRADALADKAVMRQRRIDHAKEVAAAAGVYLIALGLAYAFWVAM